MNEDAARLVVVAYPKLAEADYEWIQDIRQQHDQLNYAAKGLGPHFTFVFPLTGIEPDELAAHIRAMTAEFGPIRFVLRSGMLSKDASSECGYVFLVPDEGFSAVVKLHDRLYTGILAEHLRLDIPFIPHITVGNSTDLVHCKSVVDEINAQNFEIRGVIDTLDLIRSYPDSVETLNRFQL